MANSNITTKDRQVDYVAKDFNSVVDASISFANTNFGPGTTANRLWTNFNANSFSRTWLEINAYVADLLFFYLDQQATQAYLQTATIKSAVKDIAKQFGFVPASAASASGNVIFTFTGTGTVTLPRGFRVSSAGGTQFFLTNSITAGAPGEATGTVLQGIIRNENFTAVGTQNEEFLLQGPNVIIDDTAINPQDLSPIVTVNGNTYTLVESFIRQDGTDSPAITDSLGEVIGGGGRVFQLGEKPDGTPFLRFGDGIFGRKLQPSDTINITYRTGGGTQGNTASGTVNTLVDSSSFVTEVTNPSDFSGGSDEQSIEQLRDLIPASLRTLERAVSKTDYSDLIVSKFSEVSKASTEINTDDVGIDLNVYVVPSGNTITPISENSLLSNRLNNFIDRRKTVTVQFQLADAFSIDALITLEVFIENTASRSTVVGSIENEIKNFFNLNNGGPNNSGIDFSQNILLRDINNLLQNIEGIERFEIKRLSYRPRIQPNVQGLTTQYNNSEVTIFPNISQSEWLVAASGEQKETLGTVLFDNPDPTGFSYDVNTGEILYDFPVDLSGVSSGDLFRNGPGKFEEVLVKTRGDGSGEAEKLSITTRADEEGINEKTTIQTQPDIAGSLGGTFFLAQDFVGPVGVWFNVDSTNTTPSTGANRNIEVNISADDGAATVASSLQAALNNDSEFTSSLSGTAEEIEATLPAASALTSGQYWTINSANDEKEYYVWYNVGGSGGDPNVTGKIGIEVAVGSGDNADTVATKTATALDNNADFDVPSPSSNTIKVTNANNGPATDPADVTMGGSFSVQTLLQGVAQNIVTLTVNTKADLPDVADGSIPTNFDFTTTIQGEDPKPLSGAYFDIEDSSGPVRVWFDVDNSSTAPSTPASGRLIEVDISTNDTANTVASNLQSTLNSDSEYSATVTNNVVEVTNGSQGERSNPVDGNPSTDFSFTIDVEGASADSLDGKYFIVNDINGEVAFWFDVDDSGTSQPSFSATRSVEVNTITTGMTENQVASEITKALTSASPYTTELAEKTQITTVADTSGNLNNKYFLLNAANNSTEYYVWYNVNSGGVDPNISGKTGVEVAINTNETANNVASKTNTEIDALSDFNSSVSADEITVENAVGGATDSTVDAPSPNNTGFNFTTLEKGATFNVSTTGDEVTITSNTKSQIDPSSAGTSGFTVSTTQRGVPDNTDFFIRGTDTTNSSLFIDPDLPVNTTAATNGGGSIRNADTSFESFKVYRKIISTATNLSIGSITDNNLDLAVRKGTANALSARVLIDNFEVFVPNELATGDFLLVDGAGNIWEIENNNANTITTSITAVNDASVSNVTGGDYKVVKKLTGSQVIFNGSVFNVQFNSDNTIFSSGAQFTQIGTIGDSFSISKEQSNQGQLGISVEPLAFSESTGKITLNGSPNLDGLSSENVLIDSEGSIFSIVALDNRSLPQISYNEANRNDSLILKGSGVGTQYAQGFQVTEESVYSIVSVNMKKQGNIVGNLNARIVGDDGSGLPDITNLIASSLSLPVFDVKTSFEDINFAFANPPTLSPGVQYHLVISGDVAYNAVQKDNAPVFNNTTSASYTYDSISGEIQYASAVDLSSVSPNNFFEDGAGTLFSISNVNDNDNSLIIDSGELVNTSGNGNVIANDNVILGVDNLSPTFSSGEMSQFDNTSWSNSNSGPNQFSVEHDLVFSVEGPKSISIDSNLNPKLGQGATISKRYYDDENQLSFIIGRSSGSVTSATDVNAIGKGTVSGTPNTAVDNFVFRSTRFDDDIINLRPNELIQLLLDDLNIQIFGGVS